MLANRLRRWPNIGYTPRACMGEGEGRHYTNICQPLMLTCLIRRIDCRPIPTTVLHYRGGSMLGQRRRRWPNIFPVQ